MLPFITLIGSGLISVAVGAYGLLDQQRKSQQLASLEAQIREAAIDTFMLPQASEQFLDSLIRTIDRARGEVIVLAYVLTHKQIIQALRRAAKRRVAVYVVVDGSHNTAKHLSEMLKSTGITLIQDQQPGRKMHLKAVLIDKRVLYAGSANLSRAGIGQNIEAVFKVTDQAVIKHFIQECIQTWGYLKPKSA